MAKADVLQLVSDFSLHAVDSNQFDDFYAEVIRELGGFDVLVSTRKLSVEKDVHTYTIASDTLRIMQVYLNGISRLDFTNQEAIIDAFGLNWRQLKGTPISYTQEQEGSRFIRLVPAPDSDGELTIFRADERDDLPSWLELPVAIEVVHRIFTAESDIQDVAFARVARGLADTMFEVAGVDVRERNRSEDT